MQEMAMKVEIISRENIKPSSPTPDHLSCYKISLLDQLAPPIYVSLILFYSSADSECKTWNSNTISGKLKKSLSETLNRFYPLSGRIKGNDSIECDDQGVAYLEADVNITISDFFHNFDGNVLPQFLPFDPYNGRLDKEAVLTGVQVNFFKCGGVGIGICILHKIADGASLASFLKAWVATASGVNGTVAPRLDSAMFFQPKEMDLTMPGDIPAREKVAMKRFEFNRSNLAKLRAEVADANNPTRVEAVTALIWKCAMTAAKVNSGEYQPPSSIVMHMVNLRGRAATTLPENLFGNLWQFSVAPLMELKEVKLHELVCLLRKSIGEIDSNCVRELQGDYGLAKAKEPLVKIGKLASRREVNIYTFTSWTTFHFYDADFGWGKPARVCTIDVPFKNCITLLSTKSGDAIEAWVTLPEKDMTEFEQNQELLQFASPSA